MQMFRITFTVDDERTLDIEMTGDNVIDCINKAVEESGKGYGDIIRVIDITYKLFM